MQYTNANKLSAVISKWLEPTIQQLGANKIQGMLSNIPMINTASNWAVKLGIAPQGYSLANELSGYAGLLTEDIVTVMLTEQVSKVNDALIPSMAHNLVDKFIGQGELPLLGGQLIFTNEELQQLKKMLNFNLPITEDIKPYTVIMDESVEAKKTEIQ